MDFMRTSRIMTSKQLMHRTAHTDAQCPLCPEAMESFVVVDADLERDLVRVEGACPIHGYVSGWTRRMKA